MEKAHRSSFVDMDRMSSPEGFSADRRSVSA